MKIKVSRFRDAVRLLRVHHGMSQQDLADRMGVPKHKVTDWERGKVTPSCPDEIHKLAQACRFPGGKQELWWLCMLEAMGGVPEDVLSMLSTPVHVGEFVATARRWRLSTLGEDRHPTGRDRGEEEG